MQTSIQIDRQVGRLTCTGERLRQRGALVPYDGRNVDCLQGRYGHPPSLVIVEKLGEEAVSVYIYIYMCVCCFVLCCVGRGLMGRNG